MSGPTASRTAQVLVVSGEEVFSRGIETILVPAGWTVFRAYTTASAVARLHQVGADAIILDLALSDVDPLRFCRTLRDDPQVKQATPVILVTAAPATRQQRLDALRAGASELWSGPLDADEFVLDLEARLRTKFDADEARAGGLIDPVSGAYNAQGLARRAAEVAASAVRRRVVFGCAAFAPDGLVSADLGDRLAHAFRQTARTSDVVARVGPAEFVVLAPDTNAAGTERLAQRIVRLVERTANGAGLGVRLRSAHSALAEPPTASLDPLLPVTRARNKLALTTR